MCVYVYIYIYMYSIDIAVNKLSVVCIQQVFTCDMSNSNSLNIITGGRGASCVAPVILHCIILCYIMLCYIILYYIILYYIILYYIIL